MPQIHSDADILYWAREYARAHGNTLPGQRIWDAWARESGNGEGKKAPTHSTIAARGYDMKGIADLIGAVFSPRQGGSGRWKPENPQVPLRFRRAEKLAELVGSSDLNGLAEPVRRSLFRAWELWQEAVEDDRGIGGPPDPERETEIEEAP